MIKTTITVKVLLLTKIKPLTTLINRIYRSTAPEVIQNHDYSQTCDIWSVGVIIYVLLSKEYPFMAESEDKLFDMIKQGNLQYKNPVWKKISNSGEFW